MKYIIKMHYAHIYSTKPFQYQSVLLQSLKLVFELNIKFSKDIHKQTRQNIDYTCSYSCTMDPARAYTLAGLPHTGCRPSCLLRMGVR